MSSKLSEYRFSKHFNRLNNLGMWSAEIPDPFQKKLYIAYCIFWLLFLFLSIIFQVIDLYYSLGNMRKIAYNLCTSVTVTGVTVKVILLYYKIDNLDDLRRKLWLDSERLKEEEDIVIMDFAYFQLNFISKLFYGAGTIFLPFWLISSYFSYLWGPRSLPFPAYLPIDTNNDFVYIPCFLYQTLCGSFIIKLVMEVDLAMFSIIFQVRAQTRILKRFIMKIDEVFIEHPKSEKKKEINKCLRREATITHMKNVVKRQEELLTYCKTIEYAYNQCMLIQVVGGSVLVVMNSLEVIMNTIEVNVKLCYIAGYLVLIMCDLLFVCMHISDMSEETATVADAVYNIHWYEMDPDIQKSVCLIIRRSQKPPRITSGKLFVLNLSTYLGMLKNIYSWLMLFRQLEMK